MLVVQGYEGNDPANGKTQVMNNPQANSDAGDLNILSGLERNPAFQVVQYSSSDKENTKNDLLTTIREFRKVNSKGNLVLVGHSLGADNIVELVNEHRDIKVNVMITIDISDGLDWDDDNIPANVDRAFNIYAPSMGQPGGEKVEPARGNKRSKIKNIPIKNVGHRDIDNRKSQEIKSYIEKKFSDKSASKEKNSKKKTN